LTLKNIDFQERNQIFYTNKSTKKQIVVPSSKIIDIVVRSNVYLLALKDLFNKLDFDIYVRLGQRNLSGFIGEVFSSFFVKEVEGFFTNPHADGRPDLIDVSTPEALDYYNKKCFINSISNDRSPIRSCFAPFSYGGMEVKATIGNPINGYKHQLRKLGISEFYVGMPRIDYLSTITYWGHHTSCENLIGLFYDYYKELNGVPQILVVMQSELIPAVDWNKVSIGKIESKKTSNTSLSPSGCEKLFKNPIVVINNIKYITKLRESGLSI
jgi:hypothetical protein